MECPLLWWASFRNRRRSIGAASVWALVQLRRDLTGIPGGPSPERLRGLRVLTHRRTDEAGCLARGSQRRHDLRLLRRSQASFPPRTKDGAFFLEPLHDVLIGGDLRLTSLAVSWRRRVRPPYLLCERRESAPGARRWTRERTGDPLGPRRWSSTHRPSAAHRSLGARVAWRSTGDRSRSRHPQGHAVRDSRRLAARRGRSRRSTYASALSVLSWRSCLEWCSALHRRGTHADGRSSAQAMAGDTRTTTARGGRTRALLVVGEVAAAVLLLVGAGLLLRTLLAVDNVPRGYQAESVLAVFVDPLGGRYPTKESLHAVLPLRRTGSPGRQQRSQHRVGEHFTARRVHLRIDVV